MARIMVEGWILADMRSKIRMRLLAPMLGGKYARNCSSGPILSFSLHTIPAVLKVRDYANAKV